MEATLKKSTLTLDDFLLLSVIGKGSYAKVLLVKKKDTGVMHALKVLKKDMIQKRKQEEHIKVERNVLLDVDHPFVVKLFYAFQNDRKLFFALEYCPGGELFNLLLKRKFFTEDQARFYAAQVVLALEHIHDKNVIYRDLKPENVLIDDAGYIRITDFGLSKKGVTGLKDAQSICGTPEYLAPEVILKQGHGKPVDWWTFGCFLYEILTGVPPYYTSSKDDLFEKIKFEQPRFPSSFSPSVKDLLNRLFEKDPAKRLGVNGAKDVKSHAWFTGLKWDALLKKEIRPPFVPKLFGELDVSNFDPEFTDTSIESLPPDRNMMSTKSYDSYPGFSYAGSEKTSDTLGDA